MISAFGQSAHDMEPRARKYWQCLAPKGDWSRRLYCCCRPASEMQSLIGDCIHAIADPQAQLILYALQYSSMLLAGGPGTSLHEKTYGRISHRRFHLNNVWLGYFLYWHFKFSLATFVGWISMARSNKGEELHGRSRELGSDTPSKCTQIVNIFARSVNFPKMRCHRKLLTQTNLKSLPRYEFLRFASKSKKRMQYNSLTSAKLNNILDFLGSL